MQAYRKDTEDAPAGSKGVLNKILEATDPDKTQENG
jgi:hypothetical protein